MCVCVYVWNFHNPNSRSEVCLGRSGKCGLGGIRKIKHFFKRYKIKLIHTSIYIETVQFVKFIQSFLLNNFSKRWFDYSNESCAVFARMPDFFLYFDVLRNEIDFFLTLEQSKHLLKALNIVGKKLHQGKRNANINGQEQGKLKGCRKCSRLSERPKRKRIRKRR